MRTILSTLLLLVILENISSQEVKDNYFVEPELMVGSIVPNYPNFPKTGVSKGIRLAFGKAKNANGHWAKYYNFPSFGIAFSYTESANVKELGREYGITTFLD